MAFTLVKDSCKVLELCGATVPVARNSPGGTRRSRRSAIEPTTLDSLWSHPTVQAQHLYLRIHFGGIPEYIKIMQDVGLEEESPMVEVEMVQGSHPELQQAS